MELGLRALVAAGAQSVMTLHSCRYFIFTPETDANGTLKNSEALEEYLQSVRTEGADWAFLTCFCLLCFEGSKVLCLAAPGRFAVLD